MVQVNSTPINLRVKFTKIGSLQYISHLDLVRTMHKIIVRAKLPLWYTEGFNPKPKMVFAAPLSIGCESLCEYVDIRLTEHISLDEAIGRLNDNLTDEMRVVDAYYPTTKLTDLKWLEYDIAIKTAKADKALLERCRKVLLSPEIKVMKRSKKGEALTDIAHLIKSAEFTLSDDIIKVKAVLSADQSEFLNPEYLISALRYGAGILSDEKIINEYYTILRTQALTADLEEFK